MHADASEQVRRWWPRTRAGRALMLVPALSVLVAVGLPLLGLFMMVASDGLPPVEVILESVALTAFGGAASLVWLGGSALVLAVLVPRVELRDRRRLTIVAVGEVLYAAYTTWMYVVVFTDPSSTAVLGLVTLPVGQWVLVGLTALVVAARRE